MPELGEQVYDAEDLRTLLYRLGYAQYCTRSTLDGSTLTVRTVGRRSLPDALDALADALDAVRGVR
ncbi:MAG: hypothetical protein ACRDRL_01385 [Sciscionella sp.]